MIPILRYGLICLIIVLLPACESVPDQVRVLEKSRLVVPSWVAQGPIFKNTPEGIDYVLCKDRVLDLTLGLVQTEASLLVNLRYHVYQQTLSRFDLSHLGSGSLRNLSEELGKILDKQLGKQNITDLYFDKVSKPRAENGLIPEYYRIYALANVTSVQKSTITTALKTFLHGASNAELRSLETTLTEI